MGQYKVTPYRAEEALDLIEHGALGVLDNGRIVDFWDDGRIRHSQYETIVCHLMQQSYVERGPRRTAQSALHGDTRKWATPLRLTKTGHSLFNRWRTLVGAWL
ncbi:hypothetical protein [Kibdelosporangium aridum]|uniref:hypothetical protein n=1 Tax=Kibdelosporangium aridum TaxID=2030 RepID=UPI0011CF68CA|nr:hypothetical protein [Kibdelosporangium aridum]